MLSFNFNVLFSRKNTETGDVMDDVSTSSLDTSFDVKSDRSRNQHESGHDTPMNDSFMLSDETIGEDVMETTSVKQVRFRVHLEIQPYKSKYSNLGQLHCN